MALFLYYKYVGLNKEVNKMKRYKILKMEGRIAVYEVVKTEMGDWDLIFGHNFKNVEEAEEAMKKASNGNYKVVQILG
jgi:hypothetical protein